MSESRIRDGISQKLRLKAALQPDFVSVDERSLADMLRFLYKYSEKLRYFDENNKESGTWQDLFPQLANPEDIIAFLNDPDSFPEDKARQYQQPHFVLLLTFLKLLERTKQHLNGLTKRHLDCYFLEFLRMQKKKEVPD
ncbi:MAG: hypothetical protein D3920_07805, partial [Candidatus Electrothrix sp. AW2]|nr:hypothetical protein [Candidatus Electrothrix gigas]